MFVRLANKYYYFYYIIVYWIGIWGLNMVREQKGLIRQIENQKIR